MIDASEILPRLLVGAHLRDGADVARLAGGLGVKAVVNLQTDDDLRMLGLDWHTLHEQYERHAVAVHRVPINDLDAADLRAKLPSAVAALERAIGGGAKTYVHCNLGMWRAPAVAVAYLAWVEGWPAHRAWAHVSARRACLSGLESVALGLAPRPPSRRA